MISTYSIVMGIFWFTICAGLLLILRRRLPFLMKHSAVLLLYITILAVIRMLLPLDLPPEHTYIVQSFHIYPAVNQILSQTCFGGWALWQWLLLIWGAGSLVSLVVGGVTSARFIRAVKRLPQVEAHDLEDAAQALGLDSAQLVVAKGIPVPMVVGFLHPVIYLPPAELSEEASTWVLRHELTHIRLYDNWWKLTGLVLQTVLWWNPVVYLFIRSLDSVLELRCDEVLLRGCSQAERRSYVAALRDVAKTHCGPKQLCAGAVSTFASPTADKELMIRAKLALKEKSDDTRKSLLLLAACAALFVASYFVLIQPAGFPPEEDLAGVVEVTPENAYLVHRSDGIYELWIDGEYVTTHTESDLKAMSLNDLEIREEE